MFLFIITICKSDLMAVKGNVISRSNSDKSSKMSDFFHIFIRKMCNSVLMVPNQVYLLAHDILIHFKSVKSAV